jgi:phosphoglycolate phosphatase-like HAD superfamily hydrolase
MGADAYLFDIDGTLMRSRDRVHFNALNHAMLEAYGVETTIAGVAYHGKTDPGILRAALERVGLASDAIDSKLSEALAVVRREVEQRAGELTPAVCNGIREVLARLKDADKLMGVASGNLETIGWRKIEAAGLREFFTFGTFADEFELREQVFGAGMEKVRKQIGNGARVCFIGDTPEDVMAAKKVGAQIIAVCTGIFTAEHLLPLGPDACVASCAELTGS